MLQPLSRLSVFGAALVASACVVNPPNVTINTPGSSSTGGTVGTSTPAPTPKPTTAPTAAPSTPSTAGQSTPAPVVPATPAPVASPSSDTVQDQEPNDDFTAAQVVVPGQTIKGTAGGDTEGDTYKVMIPQGAQDGWLTLEVDEGDSDWVSLLRLYKSDKSYITYDAAESGTTQPWTKKWRVTAGTYYYVRLGQHEDPSPYTIKTSFSPVADPNEPNDNWAAATPLTLGTEVKFATFEGEGAKDSDADYFKVTLPVGKSSFRVKIDNTSTSEEATNYSVKLYKGDKSYETYIAGASRQANVDEILGTDLEPGDYYMVVTGGDPSSAISTMVVTAE